METNNLDIYGNKPIPWTRAQAQLEAAPAKSGAARPNTYWLATVGSDGRPHLAGVGGLWVDGKLCFVSGPGTRKSKNLTRNPNCAISVALEDIDLTFEGSATRVTDKATLRKLAEHYADQGWPARATDDAITAEYSAPSAGPPPWYLYSLTPVVAIGVATAEPFGASRWRFQ